VLGGLGSLGGAIVTGSLAAPPASAAGRPFDLSTPGTRWVHDKKLHHTTVMQSFAFDERRRGIYALQVISGGVRLPGEPRAYTHAERTFAGDMCLNRLSWDGAVLGRMYLKGFGHGTAMAVEEVAGGGVRLWTECDVNPESGFGRAIGRFPYAEGTVLHSSDPRVTTYYALPGTTNNAAAIDFRARRLLLRYGLDGSRRYALYDLDAFAAGRFDPLIDFAQPGADLGLPYQGMTLHDGYAYQMLGSTYDPDSPLPGTGDIRLYSMDLRTGEVVQELPSPTAYALVPREPEGLAVLRTPEPLLCMGFASGPVGGRVYSIYYQR
jgi:receptor-binding protein